MNKSSYATLKILPQNPGFFSSGDNSAEGAEGCFCDIEGFGGFDVEFDLWVCEQPT